MLDLCILAVIEVAAAQNDKCGDYPGSLPSCGTLFRTRACRVRQQKYEKDRLLWQSDLEEHEEKQETYASASDVWHMSIAVTMSQASVYTKRDTLVYLLVYH